MRYGDESQKVVDGMDENRDDEIALSAEIECDAEINAGEASEQRVKRRDPMDQSEHQVAEYDAANPSPVLFEPRLKQATEQDFF